MESSQIIRPNIALCLSTEPRFWEITAYNTQFIKKWADAMNINLHIFIHAWDHISIRYTRDDYKNIFKANNFTTRDFILDHKIEKNNIIDDIEPTDCIIENKDCLDEGIEHIYDEKFASFIGNKKWVNDKKHLEFKIKYTNEPCISQLYSILKCYDIMSNFAERNNIYYDLIIRSRFDQSLYNLFYNQPRQNAVEKIYRKGASSVTYPMVGLSKNFKGFKFRPRGVSMTDERSTGNAVLYNMLCPRFTINYKRKLWMEFAVLVGSSNIINKDTIKNYLNNIIDLAVREKTHNVTEKRNSVIETSSHWVMAEYLLQHFESGISTLKPALPWQYKLNHLGRDVFTPGEYKNKLEDLIKKEKTRKTSLYTKNMF